MCVPQKLRVTPEVRIKQTLINTTYFTSIKLSSITCAQCVVNTIIQVSGSTPCRLRPCWFFLILVREDIIKFPKVNPLGHAEFPLKILLVVKGAQASWRDQYPVLSFGIHRTLFKKKHKTKHIFIHPILWVSIYTYLYTHTYMHTKNLLQDTTKTLFHFNSTGGWKFVSMLHVTTTLDFSSYNSFQSWSRSFEQRRYSNIRQAHAVSIVGLQYSFVSIMFLSCKHNCVQSTSITNVK